MQQLEFQLLVMQLCEFTTLPDALNKLKSVENQEIVEAANSLSGQFALADVDGEQRIYHVFTDIDDNGDEQEYVEHIMNEGDDIIKFVAWFFDAMFEMKQSDTYKAAGKTYKQPKRS
ncbi:hypothetical protein [Vibrio barjaei]|jgi:hypothetical protein|uniref:Uncharacterized protein n=1 Tax=Vibrio barjaei TaxID=1676683 RepID=A0ABW7IP43_9VIBR|nr:hypothetical protein [Vibrio barjaei]MCG9789379.1 hypothetical protein [Vibrio mediterranei]MCY9871721.1 hypothetical protein [Vibrio barjaei]OIN26931.1 hypothetical protein AWH66_2000885 [Vibrio barjaei]